VPGMCDYADGSSHPVEALTPRASVHIGRRELENPTVGQVLVEGVEVGIQRSHRESSIVEP